MLMSLNDWAKMIGYSREHVWLLRTEGRIEGIIEVRRRMYLIDTDKAKILPNPNKPRREDGHVIGRSKKLKNVVVVK